MACALPPTIDPCRARQVYVSGGVTYGAFILCDDVGQLLAVYELCNGVPSGSPTYYDLAGNPYTPTGTVTDCASQAGATSTIVEAHHFDITAGNAWTTADIPTGTLVGLSYTVLEGTVTTVDANAVSIAGIPAGYSATWEASADSGELTPPASITAATASRALVIMKVRP